MTTKLVPTLAGICAMTFIAAAPAGATAQSGPSTSVSPYLVPVSSGVRLTSLLTVDDRSRPDPGVDMVGIPDGLGAFAQGRNVVLYMNHELTATAGAARAHGQTGAFVSRNVIDPVTGRIKQTSDLIQDVRYYDYATGTTSMRRPPEPPVQPFLLRFAQRPRGPVRQDQHGGPRRVGPAGRVDFPVLDPGAGDGRGGGC